MDLRKAKSETSSEAEEIIEPSSSLCLSIQQVNVLLDDNTILLFASTTFDQIMANFQGSFCLMKKFESLEVKRILMSYEINQIKLMIENINIMLTKDATLNITEHQLQTSMQEDAYPINKLCLAHLKLQNLSSLVKQVTSPK